MLKPQSERPKDYGSLDTWLTTKDLTWYFAKIGHFDLIMWEVIFSGLKDVHKKFKGL